MKRAIAVDFDGVIHDPKTLSPLMSRMGSPVHGAPEAMNALYRRFRIVVYTCRGAQKSRAHVQDWLKLYRIPFDEVTDVKPQDVEWYLDDKGLRFTTWKAALEEIGA